MSERLRRLSWFLKLCWFLNDAEMWKVRPWLAWVLNRLFGLEDQLLRLHEHVGRISRTKPVDPHFGVCPYCFSHDGCVLRGNQASQATRVAGPKAHATS